MAFIHFIGLARSVTEDLKRFAYLVVIKHPDLGERFCEWDLAPDSKERFASDLAWNAIAFQQTFQEVCFGGMLCHEYFYHADLLAPL
jgi:hypothetical protein